MSKVEKAKIDDVPQMHRLINYFADREEMLPRNLNQIYENIRDYFVLKQGEQVVACVALHVDSSDLAEVRSLAVAEDKQGQGFGAQLVKACLEEAREIGVATVFCLTYQPIFLLPRPPLQLLQLLKLPWSSSPLCYPIEFCGHYP